MDISSNALSIHFDCNSDDKSSGKFKQNELPSFLKLIPMVAFFSSILPPADTLFYFLPLTLHNINIIEFFKTS